MKPEALVDAIVTRIRQMIKAEAPKVGNGVVVAAESTPDLYRVNVDGFDYRYIRKLSGAVVGIGDTVMTIKGPDVPMTILGLPVGDVTRTTTSGTAVVAATSAFTCVNVKDMGAVGNGFTDDTNAVQSAIDKASANGDLVYFPPGQYLCDALTWAPKVKILGASLDSSIILAKSNSINLLSFTSGASYVTGFCMQDIQLNSNGKTGVTLLRLDGNSSSIRLGNVELSNCMFYGTADNAVYLKYTVGTRISCCLSELPVNGFVVDNCADTDFSLTTAWLGSGVGFKLLGTGGATTYDEGIRLIGCSTNGQAYGVTGDTVDWVNITAGSFTTCSGGPGVITTCTNWSVVGTEWASAAGTVGFNATNNSCANITFVGNKLGLNTFGVIASGDGWAIGHNTCWAGSDVDIYCQDLTDSSVTGNVCQSSGVAQSIKANGTTTGNTVSSNTTIGTVSSFDNSNHIIQPLRVVYGSGSPETVVTAPIGSIYQRTDGGAGTSIYVKESGTAATGWVAK